MAERKCCTSKDCSSDAVVYCLVCKELFCETHNEVHGSLMKLLSTPHQLLTAEEYRPENEEKRYCARHPETRLALACESCYEAMCAKCCDHTALKTMQCSAEHGGHKTRPLDFVSKKIKDELNEMLSKMRAQEVQISDGVKKTRQFYDLQMDENRSDLDKLAARVQELHTELDSHARGIRESLVNHMKENEEKMIQFEKEFAEHQQSCNKVHEQTTLFMKMKDEAVVVDHLRGREDLTPLMSSKFTENPKLKKVTLITEEEALNLSAIRLSESEDLEEDESKTIWSPTSIEYKESVEGGGSTRSVLFIQHGRLLNGGSNYPISGLDFTPNIPGSGAIRIGNYYNYSMYEHKSSLYVLQWFGKNFHIHVVNLVTHEAFSSIIIFPSQGGYHQLAVNDDYIVISNQQTGSVKVYSQPNHGHLYDMEHSVFTYYVRGVGFVNNTLVIGDYNKNQVSNLTISESPEVLWKCGDISKPTAIRVYRQTVLVASYNEKLIYALSFTGEKLRTLTLPQCSFITDFTVYENQLAIAFGSKTIKVYEIKSV